MGAYLIRRLVQAVPLLIGISLLVFLLVSAVPGTVAAYQVPAR